METTLEYMEEGGTAAFVDFREGGVDGVEAIEEALSVHDISAVVLGRESGEAME